MLSSEKYVINNLEVCFFENYQIWVTCRPCLFYRIGVHSCSSVALGLKKSGWTTWEIECHLLKKIVYLLRTKYLRGLYV